MKRALGISALLALASLLAAGCALIRELGSSTYGAMADVVHTPPERTVAPYGIEVACSRGTLNYIVPVEGGVVLVDAGFEDDAEAILRVLAGREVLAVLLTHAHVDHRAGAHVFDAPVYVGEGDLVWFDDAWQPRAIGPALGRRIWGEPPTPKDLRAVRDGDTLEIGGVRFTAHSVPGHTPGSTAWQLKDVLFTGDALQSPHGDDLYPAPWTVTEDSRKAWRSLRRLLDVGFTTLLDGHYGRADDGKALIRAAFGELDPAFPYAYPTFRPFGCAESLNGTHGAHDAHDVHGADDEPGAGAASGS